MAWVVRNGTGHRMAWGTLGGPGAKGPPRGLPHLPHPLTAPWPFIPSHRKDPALPPSHSPHQLLSLHCCVPSEQNSPRLLLSPLCSSPQLATTPVLRAFHPTLPQSCYPWGFTGPSHSLPQPVTSPASPVRGPTQPHFTEKEPGTETGDGVTVLDHEFRSHTLTVQLHFTSFLRPPWAPASGAA